MKKLFIGASALLVSLAITACGGSKKPSEKPESEEPRESEPAGSEKESGVTPSEINYDSVAQFELTKESVNELTESVKSGVVATLDALDNVNLKAGLKDFNASVVLQNSTVDGEGNPISVSLDESEEEQPTDSVIFKAEDLNLALSAGVKGLRTGEKVSDLNAYLKLEELKGKVTTLGMLRGLIASQTGYEPELDSEGSIVNPIDTTTPIVVDADLDNALSAYLYEGAVYADINPLTFDFVVDVLEEVGLDSLVPVAESFRTVPKLMARIFDESYDPELNINFPTEEEIFPGLPSDESVEEIDFAAMINGMLQAAELELSDLATIKVTSDDAHALGVKVSINKENYDHIIDFAEFVYNMMNEAFAESEEVLSDEATEEDEVEPLIKIDIPFDLLREVEFTSFDLVVEFDAKSRLSKLDVNLGELSVDVKISEYEYESDAFSISSLAIHGVKFDFSLDLDYDTDVASYIPVDTLVVFDQETAPDGYYDMTALVKAFLPTGEKTSEEIPSNE